MVVDEEEGRSAWEVERMKSKRGDSDKGQSRWEKEVTK